MRYQIFTKAILTVLLVSIISCVGKRDREEVTTVNTGTEDIITVPVETMVLKKNTSEASIPFTGIMKPISSVDIIAEVTGKVKKINKKLGQRLENLILKVMRYCLVIMIFQELHMKILF